MTEIIFNRDGILNLGAISGEEDFNPQARIVINGPPGDRRCQVCGKHISELKPFGGPGDPVVGDFSGELLVKIHRPDFPYDEEAEKAWDEYGKENPLLVKFEQPIADGASRVEYEEREDPIHWFINKFGEEKGKRLYLRGQANGCISASWECRDCIILDGDEYFEKLDQRYQNRENE